MPFTFSLSQQRKKERKKERKTTGNSRTSQNKPLFCVSVVTTNMNMFGNIGKDSPRYYHPSP
jgi:hypothetical protein